MGWSRLIVLLACAAAAACVRSNAESCGDLVCPGSLSCITDGSGSHCVDQALIQSCDGLSTGATCNVQDQGSGTCNSTGVCIVGYCGDGIVNGEEECDGSNLNGENCLTYCTGSNCSPNGLTCTSTCTYDTTGCVGACNGDGMLGAGQECNGSNFGGQSCEAFGYYAGTLECTSTCTLNFGDCNGRCGDGIINGFEQCDGTDLGNMSCETLGYLGSGVIPLSCDASCAFAPGSCTCGGVLCTPNSQTCVNNGEISMCQ